MADSVASSAPAPPSEPTLEPLSSVDHAWLRMDQPENLMNITGLFFFAEPVPIDDLRAVLRERLVPVKRFSERVRRDLGGRAKWEPVEVDMEEHVVPLDLHGDDAREALEAVVGRLMNTPLDPERPLWQFHLIDYEDGSVVLSRLHHALGDGIALMMVLLSLTEMGPDAEEANPLSEIFRGGGAVGEEAILHGETLLPEGMRLMVKPSTGAVPRSKLLLLWRLLRDLLRLVFRLPDPRTHFKGRLTPEKRCTWTDAIPLDDVKELKNALGATVNDVLLTAVAGALRRYLEHRGERPKEDLALRAVVPVSLRRVEELDALGNRFGLVFLPLPVGIVDVRARLAELRRRMLGLKGSLEAGVVLGLLRLFGALPELLQRIAVRLFGMKGTAVMTNVPGPGRTLYLGGHAIEDFMFWVPQSGGLGMGISILSYAGRVRVGVATNASLVPDPEVIVEGIHDELASMRETAGLDLTSYGS